MEGGTDSKTERRREKRDADAAEDGQLDPAGVDESDISGSSQESDETPNAGPMATCAYSSCGIWPQDILSRLKNFG